MKKLCCVSTLVLLGCSAASPAPDAALFPDAMLLFDGSTPDVGNDAAVGPDAGACAQVLPPLHTAVYAMIDRSASMSDPTPGGGTKWDALTAALDAYLAGPGASVSFGLQYFPQVPSVMCPTSCGLDADCGSCGPCVSGFCVGAGGDSCSVSDYDSADVGIDAAAMVASAVHSSTAIHAPTGSTPTSAALAGALAYAATYASAHADADVVVALVTDGDPTECDTSPTNIDALASAALAATPPVHTAVVSLGASASFGDGLAVAGGTIAAIPVDLSSGASAAIVTALGDVATQRCTYAIPAGADPTTLRLQLRDGTAVQPIGHRAGPMACGTSNAFFFDQEASPHRIELCPASCIAVRASATLVLEQLTTCAP